MVFLFCLMIPYGRIRHAGLQGTFHEKGENCYTSNCSVSLQRNRNLNAAEEMEQFNDCRKEG